MQTTAPYRWWSATTGERRCTGCLALVARAGSVELVDLVIASDEFFVDSYGMKPAGLAHAVPRGEHESLCGLYTASLQVFLGIAWPGKMRRCLDCAKRAHETTTACGD